MAQRKRQEYYCPHCQPEQRGGTRIARAHNVCTNFSFAVHKPLFDDLQRDIANYIAQTEQKIRKERAKRIKELLG